MQRSQGQSKSAQRIEQVEAHHSAFPQCDQAVPACRRCQRNGRNCPGYPAITDVTFRNTLSIEANQKQRPQALSRTSSISAPLATDWHTQAVCMFFHDYVMEPGESTAGVGFLYGLPELWRDERTTSALQETVSAVALTSLAHRSSCFDYLVPQARQCYGKALQLTTRILSDPKEVRKDSTLATILCLGMYEACPLLGGVRTVAWTLICRTGHQ